MKTLVSIFGWIFDDASVSFIGTLTL